jgi:hypothetical protein
VSANRHSETVRRRFMQEFLLGFFVLEPGEFSHNEQESAKCTLTDFHSTR